MGGLVSAIHLAGKSGQAGTAQQQPSLGSTSGNAPSMQRQQLPSPASSAILPKPNQTNASNDPLLYFPEDIIIRISSYLSIRDLIRLKRVNRKWRNFLQQRGTEECWKYAFCLHWFGEQERDVLLQNGIMGRCDSIGSSQSAPRMIFSKGSQEKDATWAILEDGDTRGNIGLMIPAVKADTAHMESHWCEAQNGWICCNGVWWFDSIATFHNVPANQNGSYTASITFKLSPWDYRGGLLTDVRAVLMVGEPAEDGYIPIPVVEMEVPGVFASIEDGFSWAQRKAFRVDFLRVPVDSEGQSVSVSLRDINCQTYKAGVHIKSFELVPSHIAPDGDSIKVQYHECQGRASPVKTFTVGLERSSTGLAS